MSRHPLLSRPGSFVQVHLRYQRPFFPLSGPWSSFLGFSVQSASWGFCPRDPEGAPWLGTNGMPDGYSFLCPDCGLRAKGDFCFWEISKDGNNKSYCGTSEASLGNTEKQEVLQTHLSFTLSSIWLYFFCFYPVHICFRPVDSVYKQFSSWSLL